MELRSAHFWVSVFSECLGSLFIVFCGCGSTLSFKSEERASFYQVALAFGLATATAIHLTRHVSGGLLNPAITLSLWFTRRASLLRTLFYILGQCIGAILGALFVYLVTSSSARGDLGTTTMSAEISLARGFLTESIITFLLVFVTFTVAFSFGKTNGFGVPLAIGITVTYLQIFSIKYTGCGMNPARSFGPAVILDRWGTGDRTDHWVYWLAPALGGMLGGGVQDTLSSKRMRQRNKMAALSLLLFVILCFVLVTLLGLGV